jgi:hypothetical protein
MTSKRTKLLAGLAVQLLLCIAASNAFASDSSEAHDLIQAAHDAVNLDKIGSYELRANVIVYGEKGKTIAGHIRVVRSGDQTRTEFQLGPYEELRITQPGKQYVVRSRDYSPEEIHFLSTFLRPWDPLPPRFPNGFFNFSRSYKQKIHGVESACLWEKQQFGERLLCFDSTQHVVLRKNFAQAGQIEFAGYVPFENGPLFPKTIFIFKSNKPVLEVKDLEIEKKNPGEDAFVAPSQAIEIEKCDSPTQPRLLKSPHPVFDPDQAGEATTVYVIVDKDGKILTKHEDHNGKGKLKGDEFMERTQTAIRQWRFSPSTCSAHPVAAEVVIEMNYVRY